MKGNTQKGGNKVTVPVQAVKIYTEGRNGVTVKRIVLLATAALVAMLVLAPAALAQNMARGDDDPRMPEPNAVAVGSHEELQQIAGQPVPSPHPGDHPGEVPTAPTQGLPSTGGPSLVESAISCCSQ